MNHKPDELDAKLEWAAVSALEAKEVKFEGFYPVVETFRGEVIWEGIVSVYDSDQGRAYVWAVKGEGDKEPQYIAVLQKPPVSTPLDAVRAWIVSEARKGS